MNKREKGLEVSSQLGDYCKCKPQTVETNQGFGGRNRKEKTG